MGDESRQRYARYMESQFVSSRRIDTEEPLIALHGYDASEDILSSQKGALVLWMLDQHLGRNAMLAGLRTFIEQHHTQQTRPILQDLLDYLKSYAEDQVAYDAFVEQWFYSSRLPAFAITEAAAIEAQGMWNVSATVVNTGDGSASVTLAALSEESLVEDNQQVVVELAAGETRQVTWQLTFRPYYLVIDPNISVLQAGRQDQAWEFDQ